MEEMKGTGFAGSSPPFLGPERAAVDVDVDPERRSPRYHETCLALESFEESSAAVGEARCVWLRVLVVHDLKESHQDPDTRTGRRHPSLRSWSTSTRNHTHLGSNTAALLS